jgi:phospholipase C
MAQGMSGFVANYATSRAHQDPGDVMRYQTAENVPVYDFLASEFAVCDRWFCSVPGSTWPNRLSSLTGEARSKNNTKVPLYSRRSFVRSLPDGVTWRWYSSDPGSLRLIDDQYRVGYEEHVAFVEKPSLVQPLTLFTDAMSGHDDFPNVAWIDPTWTRYSNEHPRVGAISSLASQLSTARD